jgi:hypothetical protein
MLRLLPMSDRTKDAEILAVRDQITLLQRQLHGEEVRFTPADRALLAALLAAPAWTGNGLAAGDPAAAVQLRRARLAGRIPSLMSASRIGDTSPRVA